MLRPEMKLPERSEFSSQALLLIRFQILYFSQIREWNKDPTSRISVPFHPGNSEYFPVFLNSGSFQQIRNYIIPIPPAPPAGTAGCGSLIVDTTDSVVSSVEATLVAFCRALLVTFAGSRIPFSTISTYSSL